MSAGDWKDLYQAALAGDLARVRYHLSRGVDPNFQQAEFAELLRSLGAKEARQPFWRRWLPI